MKNTYKINDIYSKDSDVSVAALGDFRGIVGELTDAELVDLACAETAVCGSNSDYVTDEFEKRMKDYGCPADRVEVTQIDYIDPSETLKQFAERIRDDKEF